MSETFVNAPLIELVVEVQWDLPQEVAEPEDAVGPSLQTMERYASPFYQRMSHAMSRLGYSQSERLVPTGYSPAPGSPIYRYTDPAEDAETVVYQVGDGSFSVNAFPPYKTWAEFLPAVQDGLTALLEVLAAEAEPVEFQQVSLNYVDAFDERFWGSTSRYEFLTKTLGFAITMPIGTIDHLNERDPKGAFIQFSGTTRDGDTLLLKAGLAVVVNEPHVVMDTSISHREAVAGKLEALVSVLERSHTVIHDSFVAITLPVANILRGEEDA